MALRLRTRLESSPPLTPEPLVQAALNVPITADALQKFVAACRIRLDAANVEDALDAGFSLVLAPQYGGLAGDFYHRADVGAAKGFGIGRDPPDGTLFVSGAVVFIFACGGNAQHWRQIHGRLPARGGK